MRLILYAIAALLAGCATPVVMLKNDITGETVKCGGRRIGEGEGLNPEVASTEYCVRQYEAQGFRRLNQASQALERSAAQRSATPRPPAPAVESRWLITAEGMAKANGCVTPLVSLVDKGPGSEHLIADCADGSRIAFACDFTGCRMRR